jgi:transcriptional antiterminator NusG
MRPGVDEQETTAAAELSAGAAGVPPGDSDEAIAAAESDMIAPEDPAASTGDEGAPAVSAEDEPAPDASAGLSTQVPEASDAAPEAAEAAAEVAEDPAEATDVDPEEGGQSESEGEGDDVDRQWYVVHGYSGYENRVKKNLEQRIESMGMQDKIFQVVVPTEEEIEIRGGERKIVERRVFPGYILVEMVMDETSWYVVRNTPGVTGFVGSGSRPTPLSEEEVAKIMKRIESAEPTIKVSFKVGQQVRLTEGAFADFVGRVDELSPERGRAKVLVSMFGRDTPVEIDILHLERV